MARMQAIYDSDVRVPEQKISFVMNCGKCLQECMPMPDTSPKDYARQQLMVTEEGWFQLWCNRHECNIALIKFELKAEEVTQES